MATAPKDLSQDHQSEADALLAEVLEAKRNDPAVRQWSRDAETSVEDGSVWEQIESQLAPHEIVEQSRGERR